jgi:hypothetical protein
MSTRNPKNDKELAELVVALSDVVFPRASEEARYIAAYRRWLNLDPYPVE